MSMLGNFFLVFSHIYIHNLWDFSFNKNTNHPVVIVNYFSLYSYKIISPHHNIFLQHHFKTRVKVSLFEWTKTDITDPHPITGTCASNSSWQRPQSGSPAQTHLDSSKHFKLASAEDCWPLCHMADCYMAGVFSIDFRLLEPVGKRQAINLSST